MSAATFTVNFPNQLHILFLYVFFNKLSIGTHPFLYIIFLCLKGGYESVKIPPHLQIIFLERLKICNYMIKRLIHEYWWICAGLPGELSIQMS